MVKQIKKIRRQFANELSECDSPFRGVDAWKVKQI